MDNKNSNEKYTDALFSVNEIHSFGAKFHHSQPYTDSFEIYEPLGSGVAVLDIDNDNQFEVFFAQFNDNSHSSVLYKVKDGNFTDITQLAGLGGLNNIMGAATADINNDGWTDILIYGYKELHLMINQHGKFSAINLPTMPEKSFYSGASFFNANKDEYLDLWLTRYVEVGQQTTCKGNDGLTVFCAPSALPFQQDYLLINVTGNSFEIAGKKTIDIPKSPGLAVVAADFNNDNLMDVYVANDGQENFLFTQQANGTFQEEAEIKSVSTNISGLKEASMGIAIGDYDNNNSLDLFLTHLEAETNTFYKNEIDWFADETNQLELATESRPLTGFGTGLYDLNGDNWLDIFVVNGRIQPKAYHSRENLTQQFSEKPLLYINTKGSFVLQDLLQQDISRVGRGLSFVDIDNDGDIDMFSNNNNQKPLLFENNTNPSHWFGILTKCKNKIDIGSKVIYAIKGSNELTHYSKTTHTDGSYLSSSDPRIIVVIPEGNTLDSIKIEYSNKSLKEVSGELIVKNQYNNISCQN